MKQIIPAVLMLLFICSGCKQSDCSCNDGLTEVPHYALPDEIRDHFSINGDSIRYTFREANSGKEETFTLKYYEIGGSVVGCWENQNCAPSLKYSCDCRLINSSFSVDNRLSNIRITPGETETRINWGGYMINYYRQDSIAGYMDFAFVDSLEIGGNIYSNLIRISDQPYPTKTYWLAPGTGLVRLTHKDIVTDEDWEIQSFEIM